MNPLALVNQLFSPEITVEEVSIIQEFLRWRSSIEISFNESPWYNWLKCVFEWVNSTNMIF
jgi:hypothetical protein